SLNTTAVHSEAPVIHGKVRREIRYEGRAPAKANEIIRMYRQTHIVHRGLKRPACRGVGLCKTPVTAVAIHLRKKLSRGTVRGSGENGIVRAHMRRSADRRTRKPIVGLSDERRRGLLERLV